MTKMNLVLLILFTVVISCTQNSEVTEPINEVEIMYTMPEEGEAHEGTWLQWPHHYQYGVAYRNTLDATWVSNTKVLIPNYNDPNDSAANALIQTLYPSRTVVGIDVRNLYQNGGMIHCVTQQQPVD